MWLNLSTCVNGYVQQLPRPKFVQKIKFQIGDNKEKKKEFTDCNPVTGQDEYFQPLRMFYPKVVATLSILFSMVSLECSTGLAWGILNKPLFHHSCSED